MQIFIKTEDYELWNIIVKGPYVSMTTVDTKIVKKTEEQYTEEDFDRLSKNCETMHILYRSLDANECNRICPCKSVKEIWDKLVVTYEGTSQVGETNINMFVHQYELFKMQLDETIKEMFTHFINIINHLKSLVRHLPTKRWSGKLFHVFPRANGVPRPPQLKKLKILRP